MSRTLLAAPMALVGLLPLLAHDVGAHGSAAAAKGDDEATNPLGPNAACYVCHITFVREELSKTHLAAKVTCIKCHGVSARHANDEDIGATKPGRTYERGKVNRMCRKCHKTHDVPPEAVIARWLERKLTQSPTVCTDCHGLHRIESAEEAEQG